MSFNLKKIFPFLFLFCLTIFTRFGYLNWDKVFSFHPDENNMAMSVLQMSQNSLNPNFFAYGQFPLYLTFLTTPHHNLSVITLTLRFWSAFFSSLSVLFFYFIAKKIFSSSKLSFIFSLFLIFTPGLIQAAHFGTTESILIFIFSLNILLSFLIYDHPSKRIYLLLAGLISGIGLGTKISAVILTVPIYLCLLFSYLKHRQLKRSILYFICFSSITLLFGLFFSPYSLIKINDFVSSVKYEIGVANGTIPVFYTRQFIGSLPYIFQFKKIFPYVNGIFIFIFGLIGFCFILKSWIMNHKSNIYLLITLFSSLIYFIYQGQLFVKWTRFMSPIFFIFPLLSLFAIKKIKSQKITYLLVFLSITPGIYFLKTYFSTDTRIQATNWINQNIPPHTHVLSESGNVVNLPLYNSTIDVDNFDFYSLEEVNYSFEELMQSVRESKYIFVPSRRVFKNQNNHLFPLSQKYYQSLFSGNLNFSLIKTFSNSNSLFLNPENAEETWSVFDNPIIRIYQNQDV